MSTKQWKRNPPGKAHTILQEMFKTNQISYDATACAIYKLNPEFQKFSLVCVQSVFRGAFNELRNKYGLGLKGMNSEACADEFENCAGGSGSTTKRSKPSEPDIVSDGEEDLDKKIIHKNQPVLMTVYKDPDTEEEKLCVIASLPGGISNVEFSLIGSGPGSNTAKITYSWPPILYDIPGIFKRDIDRRKMTPCHPVIVSLKNELKNHRDSIDSTPQGEIELILPISVQTAPNAISRSGGKTNDGTMVVIVELMAFHNS